MKFVIALFCFLQLIPIESLIHHLDISQDDRNIFSIETFGFYEGGQMELTISDFEIIMNQKEKEEEEKEKLNKEE